MLLDKLAELEHKQWLFWSQKLVQTENISLERLKRWKELWVSYDDLSQDQKEQDRIWAKHALDMMIKKIEKFKVKREDKISGIEIPGYYIYMTDEQWENLKR